MLAELKYFFVVCKRTTFRGSEIKGKLSMISIFRDRRQEKEKKGVREWENAKERESEKERDRKRQRARESGRERERLNGPSNIKFSDATF